VRVLPRGGGRHAAGNSTRHVLLHGLPDEALRELQQAALEAARKEPSHPDAGQTARRENRTFDSDVVREAQGRWRRQSRRPAPEVLLRLSGEHLRAVLHVQVRQGAGDVQADLRHREHVHAAAGRRPRHHKRRHQRHTGRSHPTQPRKDVLHRGSHEDRGCDHGER